MAEQKKKNRRRRVGLGVGYSHIISWRVVCFAWFYLKLLGLLACFFAFQSGFWVWLGSLRFG